MTFFFFSDRQAKLGSQCLHVGRNRECIQPVTIGSDFQRLHIELFKNVVLKESCGLALGIAVLQGLVKPDRDWSIIATTLAGIVVGIGGGAYGRVKAEGPITSVLPK